MFLNSVAIRTDEMEKSLEFYEKVLGFTFNYMMSAAPGKRIAFLTEPDSGMNLELISHDVPKAQNGSRLSLTVQVDQISRAKNYLKAKNVRITAPPRTVKDGKKILTAVDPNGVEIDFIEFKKENE